AHQQRLAAAAVLAVPGAPFRIGLARLGGGQHAPVGEVAHQLLPAVDHGVGQPAGVVDVDAGVVQRPFVLGAQFGQRVDVGAGLGHHPAVVGQVDEVGRVALARVGAAAALPAV